VVVEDFNFEEPKTKFMADALNNLVGDASALVLMPEKDQAYENVVRSSNNIGDAKILLAGYVNIRDVLGYDKVILPLKTLDVLAAHLG